MLLPRGTHIAFLLFIITNVMAVQFQVKAVGQPPKDVDELKYRVVLEEHLVSETSRKNVRTFN